MSGEVISVEITQAITGSSTQGFASYTMIAFLILVLVYGITRFHPVLGAIAVVPIVLVLVWVLGTRHSWAFPTTSSRGSLLRSRWVSGSTTRSMSSAMRHALRASGSAVVASGLTTALGFGVPEGD